MLAKREFILGEWGWAVCNPFFQYFSMFVVAVSVVVVSFEFEGSRLLCSSRCFFLVGMRIGVRCLSSGRACCVE